MKNKQDNFYDGRDTAISSARDNLAFILENEKNLLKLRNGKRHIQAARSFWDIIRRGGMLTPNQLSYIDGIYEMVWKGKGYESVQLHSDRSRKNKNNP